ncbi:hypothetical protein K4A83_05700 [Spirulina subsalsa FACHB-351]|uniref:histidine kinase n=1 Tax=Spirulina subsalsa FACHB-351 TaxID=234711 RepID=A0ABT3L2R7_9CYAN|nr:sensor histidine kinase [Spirulina subsalsa]MCW6035768.1 hypothetical protein [Spirulina subsalsa FACHB-351]
MSNPLTISSPVSPRDHLLIQLAQVNSLDSLISSEIMLPLMTYSEVQSVLLLLPDPQGWRVGAIAHFSTSGKPALQIPSHSEDSSSVLRSPILHNLLGDPKVSILENLQEHPDYGKDPYIPHQGINAICRFPLQQGDEQLGWLLFTHEQPSGHFVGDRLTQLHLISYHFAIALQRTHLTQTLHQTQVELKLMQERVMAQEKLASLGALTAGIAHEVKNPLNFVNNFAELSVDLTQELLEELETFQDKIDSETWDYLEEILNDLQQNVQKINHHGKRADSIVKGMLQQSGGKPGERKLTDINALLQEYVNLAYHGMRANDSTFNITLNEQYDPEAQPIFVVPHNLSRVFLNLFNNACYAAHEQKKRLGEDFSPTLWVKTQAFDQALEIRIRDNGMGIPPEIRQQVFQPFFTTKPVGIGTGLGLAISYDIIVEEHKGRIEINSEINEYTEFVITLPTH